MNRKNSAHDSLLSYLDELLTDVGDQVAPSSAQDVPQPVVREKPASATQPVVRAEPPLVPQRERKLAPPPMQQLTEFRELERDKREQLQSLLNSHVPKVATVTESKPAPGNTDTQITTTAKQHITPVITPVTPVAPPAEETAAEPAAAVSSESDGVEHTPIGFSQSINDVLEWADNGRPQWAQSRFDVLLFDVAGLTLAVPLIALGQIQPIGEELTPIFGQSEWFMGLLNTPQGQIRTVNTALFVMPEKYSECFVDSAKYVISIDGLPWGLAVDSVNQPITLDPADVKWRTQRTSRPWLAGTVKSAMCALIDIPRMAALLKASEKSRQSLA